MVPLTLDAYKLLHNGAIAFQKAENSGIRIDVRYATEALRRCQRKRQKHLQKALKDKTVKKYWAKEYGGTFDITNDDQLSRVIYDKLGYPVEVETKSGKPSVDKVALSKIKEPFIKDVLAFRKYKKGMDVLSNILRETIDEILHPFLNLHLVKTYRSSSDQPNFQNMPIRDPELARLIRLCFIPRKGRHLVELDYKQQEVHTGCWYHGDQNLITYISDDNKDLHADMACMCYMISPQQLTKQIRYAGKNKFVFPEFYGDYFGSCAKALWGAIDDLNLETKQGVPLKQHLVKKGIHNIEQFTRHIKKIEHIFWEEMFYEYSQWKDDAREDYYEKGYFDFLTGFREKGLYGQNDIINHRIQGVAFHCLLWSFIKMTQYIDANKMISLLLGQIHDSALADVHPRELDDFIGAFDQIATIDIRKHWSFITTPLCVEKEICPIDQSWFTKMDLYKHEQEYKNAS